MRQTISMICMVALAYLSLFSLAPAAININVDAVQKSVVFLYAANASGAVDVNRPIGTAFATWADVTGVAMAA